MHSEFLISIFAALLVALGLSACGADSSVAEKAPLPGASSKPAPIKTPASAPTTGYTIYAAGDIADCSKHPAADSGAATTAALITAELARNKKAAVLTLGDNTYPVGLPIEYASCYQPTWGAFKHRTHPSPGNHDYGTPHAAGYFSYFGAAAGPKQRGYYSFQLGKWHIVSLNSNLRNTAHQEQLTWLKADLAQHPAKCTLAYWHHPLFSSGGHGNNRRMQDIWQALEVAQAEVVLVSHDHNYERFAPQDSSGLRDDEKGIREFVVGNGGAYLTPHFIRKKNSEVFDNSTNGVLKMVLKDGGYDWQFLAVDGGTFTDQGSALCH